MPDDVGLVEELDPLVGDLHPLQPRPRGPVNPLKHVEAPDRPGLGAEYRQELVLVHDVERRHEEVEEAGAYPDQADESDDPRPARKGKRLYGLQPAPDLGKDERQEFKRIRAEEESQDHVGHDDGYDRLQGAGHLTLPGLARENYNLLIGHLLTTSPARTMEIITTPNTRSTAAKTGVSDANSHPENSRISPESATVYLKKIGR
ncbi:hypothetical protein DRJ25_05665 [Candidatus Woesearchaeota archaeon]|nr:MAG: hypothetical protein DRJ25_05665 [Candidatus Woesearchaeota archaeon]